MERETRLTLEICDNALEICLADGIVDMELMQAVVVKPDGGNPYEGAYEVEPMVVAQTLPTQYKYMEKDVTVLEIPYHEVSNTNGTTVIIGGAAIGVQ